MGQKEFERHGFKKQNSYFTNRKIELYLLFGEIICMLKGHLFYSFSV